MVCTGARLISGISGISGIKVGGASGSVNAAEFDRSAEPIAAEAYRGSSAVKLRTKDGI